ncbi:MAG: helix-turn-helix domain-containing protein [Bacteroidetes bacterium]|nr:helix-turn-helix domain-containing protein [Bacteroidota bacterium]
MKHIPVRHIAPNHEPAMVGNMSIRELGPLVSKQNLTQELHRHDFYLLIAIERGTGTHEIDFVPHRIRNYSVFFLHPGQVHQINLKKGSSGFIMQFTAGVYRQQTTPMQLFQQTHFIYNAQSYQKIHALLTSLFDEYQKKASRFEEVIQSYLHILITELIRSTEQIASPIPSVFASWQRYDQLTNLMEAQFLTHKDAAYYADQLNMTPYQLNAITKQAVGKTCAMLIQDRVLLEAKRLLFATSLQVNEIAYQLGYEDPSYFIRFFKKHTGYTPDALRQLK